jgi:glyoxylase-like metal-dependent hydrolase (beta-lactamase superfamily II)
MSAGPALDASLWQARQQVERALAGESGRPVVRTFFDEATFTASHVVHDPATRAAAVIDSVMDYDPASGRTSFANADQIVAYAEAEGLKVDWLLETHAHADHLSAAPYLQQKLGGKIAIGEQVRAVQQQFAKVFNSDGPCDGSQFDRLFADGDMFSIGSIPATVLHVPGHTPADLAYVIGDAAFVGDTLFMPDYGTARCDFPGGDARQLYRSIQRLMGLPDATRVFLCHDYQAPNRPNYVWETTIGAERTGNIHLRDGTGEEEFVAMRTRRDATLSMPKLLLPAVQVNMRAGRLPEPDANGTRYLKIPLNRL